MIVRTLTMATASSAPVFYDVFTAEGFSALQKPVCHSLLDPDVNSGLNPRTRRVGELRFCYGVMCEFSTKGYSVTRLYQLKCPVLGVSSVRFEPFKRFLAALARARVHPA